MSAFLATDFNNLSKLLFHCLSSTNPKFDPVTYSKGFELKNTNLDRVNYVYTDIKKYPNVFSKFTKDIKSDERALQHIDSGKIKFNSCDYWGALEDYSRGVACAESDTVLALTYGHRSECFFQLEIPHKCVEEIDRALKLKYPMELIETLIERRKQAQDMGPHVHSYCEDVDLQVFNKNNCVQIGSDEDFRHVVASRDIEIGEILAVEEPFACVLTEDRYSHCHHCLHLCYNLVPCNNCTMALFCSDLCKQKAQRYHKYECPLLLTVCYRILCEFSLDNTMLLALRVAILAKDEHLEDRLKSPALFTHRDIFHQAILTAIIFQLLWNYTSFFSSMFANSDTEDKFKEVMMLQLQINSTNSTKIYEYVQKYDFNGTASFGCGAYAFFSLFSHSCCANVMKTYHGTTMVLRALNSIKKDEQCFVNRYSLRYDTTPKIGRQQFMVAHKLPKCVCKACQNDWSPHLGDVGQICENLDVDVMPLGDIVRNVISTDVTKASKFLRLLIEQLRECESEEPRGNALALKSLIVHCYVILGNKKIEFSKVHSGFGLLP